ncbi:MAG: insulinase family protein [Patescibacteria group bacterium]
MLTRTFHYFDIPIHVSVSANGLSVITVDTGTSCSRVGLFFRGGAWLDGKSPGLAHMVEHLLVEGRYRKGACLPPKCLEKVHEAGMTGGAFTGYLTHNFFLNGPNDQIPLMVTSLLETCFDHIPDSRTLPLQQRIHEREFDYCGNTRPLVSERIFPKEKRLRQSIGGTSESIRQLTMDDVEEFIEKRLLPVNATLVICGKADHGTILDLVDSAHYAERKGEAIGLVVPEIEFKRSSIAQRSRELHLLYQMPMGLADSEAARLAMNTVCGDQLSLAMIKLRAKKQMIYCFQRSLDMSFNFADIGTKADPLFFNEIEQAVVDGFESLAAEKAPKEGSSQAKHLQIFRNKHAFESKLLAETRDPAEFYKMLTFFWQRNNLDELDSFQVTPTPEAVAKAAESVFRRHACVHLLP